MANIYQTGSKVAAKAAAKIDKLASDLLTKGKTTDEIVEAISSKVPGVPDKTILEAIEANKAVAVGASRGVEPGKELATISSGMARPVRPETSSETALVPTGRPSKTTFIAGEEGVSVGGQSPMGPIPVMTQPGTLEERIRQSTRPQGEAAPSPSRGLTTTQKVGAGMAVAGATGMATRGEDRKEEPLPGFNITPRITSDGEFAPGETEMAEAIRKGQDAVSSLWGKYDRLNEELKQRPLTGYRSGASVEVQRAEQFLNEMRPAKEVKPTGPGILARPPEETPPIPEKEKPAIVKPAPPLGGVSATEPSAQVKATKATVPGQVQTVQAAKTGVDSLKEKLLSGAPLGRGDLLSVLKEIEQIKPEAVTKDTTLINQLKAAREDARTAYREQANRNEWYEVAQTLGNAVANFIAAQRGVADRALALPQIDYGERTGRALREYQTELGSIGEQEQALERGTEKQIAAAERKAETDRRSWEKYLALGEKQVEAAERKAERDKDLATKIALAKADDERSLKVATAKAEEKKQEAAKSNAKDYLSAVKSQVSLYDNQIEDAQRKLKAAQTFSTTDQKNFNKNFQEYMTSLSTEKVPVTEESYQAKGFFGGTSFKPDLAKKDAAARVKELTDRVSTLNQKKNAAVAEEAALLEGRTTTPPAQAGQAPVSGDMVDMVAPDGGKLKVPANKVAEAEKLGAVRAK